MTPKVGTVCKRFIINLKNDIVNLISFFNIGTVGQIVCNFHNTAVIVRNTDFAFTATHTVWDKACKLSRCNLNIADFCANLCKSGFKTYSYVRCAANNVCKLAVTCVNLKKMKFFWIRVIFYRFNFSNNDAADIRTLEENLVFNLCGGKRETMDKVNLIKTCKINKVWNPIHW